MSRIGAIFAIAAAIAVGFAVMIVLEQRFGTKEKLRETLRDRLPILGQKPWLLLIAVPVFEAVLGGIFLVMRLPEILFYLIGGAVLGAAVSLMDNGSGGE